MKYLLAILLSVTINLGVAESGVHAFEEDVSTPATVDIDQTTQNQKNGENGEASHASGDCHLHIIVLKQAQLACHQVSAEPSRHWTDVSVILATFQGFYRPPRG